MRSMLAFLMVVGLVPGLQAEEPPPLPATPAAVESVLFARPFQLEKGFEFDWRAEKPTVKSGWLLVLKVDPALVYPRNAPEPIVYVGDTTAARLNQGHPSGRLAVLVPGELDLAKTPIWFGTPGLPEQVTAQTIKKERAAAEKAGLKPLPEPVVKAALAKGGEPLKSIDRTTLGRYAAKLIKEYSPEEKDLIEGLLIPPRK